MSPNETYPQHIVTAVIVAHDGAAWLPHVADAVLEQTRPVQRVVAVDTGSRDRSGAVLASKFGQAAVFGMDRSTGYGAAITRALQHRAANTQVPGPAGPPGPGGSVGPAGSSGERIEWLWLLHDDCEPAHDALEQLLRGTIETTSAAVLGPKLRDWSNREVILEAGVTLDTATRRVTAIEPREVDQGQHDGDRDALAVSSAGMLVRRDVWEQVGGFDHGMALFMEDIDFCWRVHAAGYRVRVITDAIAYHVQAATRHRRSISVGRRARMLDRRNGLLTLLGNLPLRQMLTSAAGNVLVSLLRITFFLLAKRLAAAMDELTAIVAVLCHPIRLIKMRSRRSRGRRAAYSRVRADLPPGHSARRLAEFAMSALSKSQQDTTGAHHASADPTEDDSMLVDNGLGRRLLTSPSLLTFIVLLAVAVAAGRALIGSGPLGGGSLVPAWGGASDLWSTYLQSFHPAGIGSTTPAPPWLAVVAAVATVLTGKPWLAIDVIMIGCVPLAGMTAMFAVRKVTKSVPVRVWVSVTYALLPVAMGVIASGRFGTAVAFVLLPLIAAQAGRMLTQSGPPATRAAWATGLLVAIAAAFVPLVWLITFAACLLAAIVFRTTRRGLLRNLAVAALVPPLLLLPWTLTLFSRPAGLLLEAGLPQPGTPVSGLPARALMLLSPGGPGLPPYWVTAGLLGVALIALFAGRRRRLVTAGWGVALSGLLTAIIVSHLTVRPDDGGPVVVWAGLPLALAALGLLLAAAAGADALGRLLAGAKGWRAIVSGRGPWAALLALVACSAPVLAATAWLSAGITGPIHPVANPVVPELVAVAAGQGRQVRTLVLRSSGGHISYLLLRGSSPSLADTALTPPPQAQRALSKAVSALTTPDAGLAANQEQLLADLDIGYVLVQAPVEQQLANVLGNVSGLRPYSTTSGYSLWQLDTPPARVAVAEPGGTVVPIPSGAVGVSAASAPAAGGTLMLSEPAGGWSASVNGHALAEVPSPAGSWAQAFRLPAGGGSLSIGHSGLARDLMLLFELLALAVVVALALPGVHVAEQEALAAGLVSEVGEAGQAAAGGSAERGASVAGARRAGSQRLSRGVRSKAGRGRAAAHDRVGRNKAGRAATAGNRAGTSNVGLDDGAEGAGLAAGAAARAGSARSRPPGSPGRREAGAHDTRLADAWPYTASDEQRDDRPADAWPYAAAEEPRRGTRRDARPPDQRPYPASIDPAETAQRRGRSGGPPGRAWSYSDEQDLDTAGREDFPVTGPSGRPYDEGEPEPGSSGRRSRGAGRSPSGRSPAGDWPYPELDPDAPGDRAPAAGRSPSGRSPAGAWPYSDADQPSGGRHSTPGGRSTSAGPASKHSDSAWGYEDLTAGDRADRDLPPGRGQQSTRGYPDPAEPGSRSGSWPQAEPGRTRSRRSDREPDADPRDREPDVQRRGRWGSGRPARHGSHRPSGRQARTDALDADQLGADPLGAGRAGRPERPDRPDRRGRRGRDDRPAGSPGSHLDGRRAAEPSSAWSGGDDALEPLPPPGGPGRAQNRRSAWRPAEDTGGWGAHGDDEAQDQRWSAPLAEYEPEYEGDGW